MRITQRMLVIGITAALAGTACAGGALVYTGVITPDFLGISSLVPNQAPVQKAETIAPKSSAPSTSAALATATEALKTLGNQVERAGRIPSFDIARIEPDGAAVIAGRAGPGASVELLRGGEVHDRVVANPSGEFVFVPKPLPPGNYDLTLRATESGGKALTSKDSVAVELRAGSQSKPVVALMAPDKPAVVLSKPAEPAVAPPKPVTEAAVAPSAVAPPKPAATETAAALAIDAVESETGGKLYVSGRSAPGASVRLYLNDSYIASAVASTEGRVAFSIQSGVRPGVYRVRLDHVDAPGNVRSRAEVAFTAPASVAVAAAAPATVPLPPAKPAIDTVVAARTPAPDVAAPPSPPAPAATATVPQPVATAPAVTAPVTTAPSAQPPAIATAPAPSAPVSAPAVATSSGKPPVPAATAEEKSASPAPAPDLRVAAAPPVATPMPSAAPTSAPASRDTASAPAPAAPSSEIPPPAPAVLAAASTPAAAQTTADTPASERKDVVIVPRIETTVVARGDSLWRISQSTYGNGVRYSVIYAANRTQIRDPDLIYPGQIFVLPKKE